jgi:hypothetical protein
MSTISANKKDNPLIFLIHSTYTKLGQCPYKNPNPKLIRFVHFLLELILVGPRSNRCSKSTLFHFPTSPQHFSHFLTAFLGTGFPLFPACSPVFLRCFYSFKTSSNFPKIGLRQQAPNTDIVTHPESLTDSSIFHCLC